MNYLNTEFTKVEPMFRLRFREYLNSGGTWEFRSNVLINIEDGNKVIVAIKQLGSNTDVWLELEDYACVV